jgi:hypothetical protein
MTRKRFRAMMPRALLCNISAARLLLLSRRIATKERMMDKSARLARSASHTAFPTADDGGPDSVRVKCMRYLLSR